MQVLCNSDQNAEIKFAAVRSKDGVEINSVVTTVNNLLEHKILNGREGSKFALQSFELIERSTLIDYLKAGWSVSLVAAIDFTASNGDPQKKGTNHYIISEELNSYEKALIDVGSAIEIEQYDNTNDS